MDRFAAEKLHILSQNNFLLVTQDLQALVKKLDCRVLALEGSSGSSTTPQAEVSSQFADSSISQDIFLASLNAILEKQLISKCLGSVDNNSLDPNPVLNHLVMKVSFE